MTGAPVCRLCGERLALTVVDLGEVPIANDLLRSQDLDRREPVYPLHARACESCWLVQVDDVVPPGALFGDYTYFSSISSSWVEHARQFATAAAADLGLDSESLVLEVASNDGYLLRHFVQLGIPVLGVEPAETVAAASLEAGIPTEITFFGMDVAERIRAEHGLADLIVANNVVAHVPDLRDLLGGMKHVLASSGVISVEVPHVLNLLAGVQFDTIYHEHYSYFSLFSIERAFESVGLAVHDVEQLSTHGGSLRLWTTHVESGRPPSDRLIALRRREQHVGVATPGLYRGFCERVERCRDATLAYLTDARVAGRRVAGYGAAAKATTFTNYCGITSADIEFVADSSPHKQGRWIPGSRLPIVAPEELRARRPDDVLVFAWNLKHEIAEQLAFVSEWSGRILVAVPEIDVVSP